MDNAKIHKGEEMNVFYKDNGILPVFLLIQNSDRNPSEQIWRMVRRPFKNKVFKKSEMREAFTESKSYLNIEKLRLKRNYMSKTQIFENLALYLLWKYPPKCIFDLEKLLSTYPLVLILTGWINSLISYMIQRTSI